ncbi:hypothetical protein SLE2022_118450 [Rubroshorea leprosula]
MEKEAAIEEAGACASLPSPPPKLPATVKPEMESPKRSIVTRHGVGRSGHPISLQSNHFNVSVSSPDVVFYHYNVTILSEDDKAIEGKGIGRKLVDTLYETFTSDFSGKRFAYDGERSLYTVGPLPQIKQEYPLVLEESFAKCERGSPDGGSPGANAKRSKHSFRSKSYKVGISYAATISFKPVSLALKGIEADNGTQDSLRVLDIILRQQAANRGCLLVRQSFFHDDSRNFVDVGGGVSAVRGFHSSFRATQRGLSLNLDVSTTMILTPGPVINFLITNQNVQEPRQIDWMKAKRMLKNMRIKTMHRNTEYKITGLSEKPCNQQYFPMKVKNGDDDNGNAVEITVYEYFTKHCGIELKYSAYLPCLDVGKPKRPNYLPLELCSLVSLQRYTKALSSNQRATLVEKSRQKPPERMRILADALRSHGYNEDPVLAACGISIEKQLTQVEGRILETPKLKVGRNEDCIPHNGRWNFNNKMFLNPTKIETWGVVNFSARCDMSFISRELINCGRNKGIHIERPQTLVEEDQQFRRATPVARVERMFEQLKSKFKEGPPQFILCVLPERKNSDIYGPWKRLSLVNFGVVTQCISPFKINDQYLTNVLLKINAKLGGINSLLAIERPSNIPLLKDTPTLILGMDVSHGSPGRADIPSIAAVVGSRCWPLISIYRASVRTQSPRAEMIESLYKPLANGHDDGIIRELLMDFYATSNHCKPKQIILFRDGVSESQFNQVLNIEVEQIIKAYQNLGEVYLPKFTVIVTQKNHHTRLFLANQAKDPVNVPPGTVVDTKIVHPRNYDFYMCAHAGMIGTSRPAHYHVLLDEIGFTPDDLQNLIHSLSYVYQRSTTAISIVAPICYAHLAAKQVGQFLKFEDLENSSEQKTMTSSGNIPVPELPRLNKAVARTMFFC